MSTIIKKFLKFWKVGGLKSWFVASAVVGFIAFSGAVFYRTELNFSDELRLKAFSEETSPVLRFPERADEIENPARLQAMNVSPVLDSGLALQWHLMSWPNSWFERFPLSLDQNLRTARVFPTEDHAYWATRSKPQTRTQESEENCPQATPLTPAPSRIWDSAILNAGQHVGQVWVSDSMADLNHPDLAGSISVKSDRTLPKPDTHGTHVTGLMSALRNGEGVVGVVPGLRIILHPLELLQTKQGPRVRGQDVLRALDEMFGALVSQNSEASSKNRVILLSWSFFEGDGISQKFLAELETKIKSLLEHDIVLVVPAGNFEKGNKQSSMAVYPSGWATRFRDSTGVFLPVSALDFCAKPAWFSGLAQNEFGSVLAAPGERIYSTFPNKDFGYISGTSASAAQVAAVLAFTSQQYPDVEMKTQVQTLLRTSSPIAASSDRLVSFDASALVQGLMSEYGWIAKH